VVQGLAASYPRSFLIAIEYANLLSAAGHGPESIANFRQILANYKDKKYSLPEPAKAAFGLGIALRGQHRFQEAAEAFDLVGTLPGAERELIMRATLAAGEMYDTMQKRELAVKRYEVVLSAGNNAPSADLARRHIKQPFQYR
jgi:tetratricopeptide (TPR) repeat protein